MATRNELRHQIALDEIPGAQRRRVTGLMQKSDPIVYVVADNAESRASIRAGIAKLGHTCETFSSGELLLGRLERARMGCVIVDLHRAAMDGVTLQKRLIAEGCVQPIIVICATGNVTAAVHAMQNGAVTVLEKPYEHRQLIDAIDTALAKGRDLQMLICRNSTVRMRFQSLDDREREAMLLILCGMPNKNIARALGVSQRTTNRLRAGIFNKMGIGSAVELARVAALLDDFSPDARLLPEVS